MIQLAMHAIYSPNGWTDTEVGIGYLRHLFGSRSKTALEAENVDYMYL